MHVRSTILAAAALAAGFAASGFGAAPAVAQPLDAIEVAYLDLNLSHSVGRETLDRRIAHAARALCGEFLPVELRWRALSGECQQDVVASVQAQRDALVGGQRYAVLRVSRAAN